MKTAMTSAIIAAVGLLTMCPAQSARAQSISTGLVSITDIGCGMASPPGSGGAACWVDISGPAVGPSGCSVNSIRWDPTASPNGQVAITQLTAAFVAGHQVTIVLQNTCWAEWPTFPTIWYYIVH